MERERKREREREINREREREREMERDGAHYFSQNGEATQLEQIHVEMACGHKFTHLKSCNDIQQCRLVVG